MPRHRSYRAPRTRTPILAITMGDYNGIGPEVVLKSIRSPRVRQSCRVVLVGSVDAFADYAMRLGMRFQFQEISKDFDSLPATTVPVIQPLPFHIPRIRPGHVDSGAGRFAVEAIACTTQLCAEGRVDGMVTAPVSKEAMRRAGSRFPGQTELLARRWKSSRVLMMLVGGALRVGLATIHTPLRRVSRSIDQHIITEKLALMYDSLAGDFGIASPRIAVLGLNPHAGEGGHIGIEEQQSIIPAIRTARRRGWEIAGPFPADGFFGAQRHHEFDGVMAMYHDQGLIPLKMEAFGKGVNFSAGLPHVRTSPDHGTAFDIAGTGNADPGSMIEAIILATVIVQNRRSNR
jgi:4-hydroxythreonine-4-phosphate dehydrogenase